MIRSPARRAGPAVGGLEELAAGLYFLELRSNGAVRSQRLVVARRRSFQNLCQSLVTVWWTPSSKFCHRTLTCGFTVTLAG